jgi:hypothetical protein
MSALFRGTVRPVSGAVAGPYHKLRNRKTLR